MISSTNHAGACALPWLEQKMGPGYQFQDGSHSHALMWIPSPIAAAKLFRISFTTTPPANQALYHANTSHPQLFDHLPRRFIDSICCTVAQNPFVGGLNGTRNLRSKRSLSLTKILRQPSHSIQTRTNRCDHTTHDDSFLAVTVSRVVMFLWVTLHDMLARVSEQKVRNSNVNLVHEHNKHMPRLKSKTTALLCE